MTIAGRTVTAALGSAFTLAALFSSPSSASADPTVPPPGSVTISLVDSIGSGCPKGTVGFSADPVSFTFTLTPAGFRAQAGGTSQPTDHRRNCQNTVGVAAPEEFTFAIAEADHGGHAHLAPGASGQVSWRHHFQGSGTPGTTWRHSLSGPYSDGWQFTDKIDIASLDFRRCGESRHTYIGLELTVDRGTSDASETSLMLMEPPDGSTFRLVWKRCPKP